MFKFLGRFIYSRLPEAWRKRYNDTKKQWRNGLSLSYKYGQYESMRQWSCVDASGHPIPWYTYPAIEYLAHLDFSKCSVLEFGSGNSSLWWMGRCKSLTSIESDAKWHEKISHTTKVNPSLNFSYFLCPERDDYVNEKRLHGADVIVIDGAYRGRCVQAVTNLVMEGKLSPLMIVFDNADWYPQSIEYLRRSLGWVETDFHGFGPINPYTWTTTVFVNPVRASELRYARSLRSIDAIDHLAKNEDDDA